MGGGRQNSSVPTNGGISYFGTIVEGFLPPELQLLEGRQAAREGLRMGDIRIPNVFVMPAFRKWGGDLKARVFSHL